MKKLSTCILFIFLMGTFSYSAADKTADTVAGTCMVCHKQLSPGLYSQWLQSTHADNEVTCIECHGADKSEPDAFQHFDAWIATLVTPKDCGQCHSKETQEVAESYHATAGQILESQDAYLAHVTGGQQVAIMGCESCHGAKMKIDDQSFNKLSKETWPNSGIGRINPDGSMGSCNACHPRHHFSKAQARQPESCAKCHLGPDHPQREIYEESKHGNTYQTNRDKMNLASMRWIVGSDYFIAPTCATCHMGATQKQASTHDVGSRLKWTLRPAVSIFKDQWQQKRKNMKDVCLTCHANQFVDGHFYQFDGLVHLYNEKFAKPAGQIMALLKSKNLLEVKAEFGNDVEWEYWELWHHEGRRTRHGAAMMGPDYTWWHGMYDVAHNFYFKFIPKARSYQDPEVNALIDNILKNDPMHQWLGQSTEQLKEAIRSGKLQQIYKKLFTLD
jgi:hydroxylamine dehydrogenase